MRSGSLPLNQGGLTIVVIVGSRVLWKLVEQRGLEGPSEEIEGPEHSGSVGAREEIEGPEHGGSVGARERASRAKRKRCPFKRSAEADSTWGWGVGSRSGEHWANMFFKVCITDTAGGCRLMQRRSARLYFRVV